MSPGGAQRQFESKFGVRRGHLVRVTWTSSGGTQVTTGLCGRVSVSGWLHLYLSDGNIDHSGIQNYQD